MLNDLWRLARLGAWMGATVFGGISVSYPIIRAKAIEFGWLSGEEVDGLYAVAVFLPAPSFMNLWGAVCFRVAGLPGALVGEFSLLLPSFLLVVGLTGVSHLPWVAQRMDLVLQAAAWATSGLLLAAGAESLRLLGSNSMIFLALTVLVLLGAGVHPLALLVAAVAFGAIQPLLARSKEGV